MAKMSCIMTILEKRERERERERERDCVIYGGRNGVREGVRKSTRGKSDRVQLSIIHYYNKVENLLRFYSKPMER